jgi:hypothetical protein
MSISSSPGNIDSFSDVAISQGQAVLSSPLLA